MQTLFIPPLGTQMTLEQDWRFTLHYETRNKGLFDYFNLTYNSWHGLISEYDHRNMTPPQVTLPKGALLVVDRIYIRKSCEDFDSITFKWMNAPSLTGKKSPVIRF